MDEWTDHGVSGLDYLAQLVDRGGYRVAAGRIGDAADGIACGRLDPDATIAELATSPMVPPGAQAVVRDGQVGLAQRVDELRQRDFNGADLGRVWS